MREVNFEKFLSNEPAITSQKAIMYRIYKGRRAEEILNMSLDTVVSDDDLMYESLEALQPYDLPAVNHLQNAVRKYYKFANGKEFPRMRSYCSPKHPKI